MRTDLRSPELTNAIRHAIDEARLADEFLRQPMRTSYALEDTSQTGPDVLFEPPPESPHPFSRTLQPSSPSCAEIW